VKSENMAAAIEVANLSQRFGEVRALDDVSLTVARGEMFGLIGHNGAGKSTLFKLMLGLIQPSAGEVRVQGEPIRGAGFRQVRRRIGYLPESFVTYDNLTGLEVLQLFADLKKFNPGQARNIIRDSNASFSKLAFLQTEGPDRLWAKWPSNRRAVRVPRPGRLR